MQVENEMPSPDSSGIPRFFCADTVDSRKKLLKKNIIFSLG